MKRWVVLAQGPQETELDCYEVSGEQVIVHGKINAETLHKLAGIDPIVVAITGHHWTCVDVTLPNIKPTLLQQALPHMVEDTVLSSPDEIHCALPQKYQAGELCTVLVMARDAMQGWVDWSRHHGLNMQALIPAYCLLPMTQDHMSMISYDNTLWLRYTDTQGYCVPLSLADTLLDKLITHEHIDLFGDITLNIKEKLSTIHPQMLRLQDCILHTDTFAVNFLQGDFKARKHKDKTKRGLKLMTLCLGVTALVAHMVYLGVSHVVLSARLAALKQESLALYQKAYPDATVVTSPKTLITRALGEGAAGSNRFVEILSVLAQAADAYPLKIQQIEYRDKQLVVMGSVRDFMQLEGIVQVLKEKGYVAEQQKAEQADGRVEVSLLIARGAQ